uniref:Uncharacterized protein n=1 Tax=Panagrolaimus sp. JU765 TaxID=591449 RepID=A0AC34REP6_9BILA
GKIPGWEKFASSVIKSRTIPTIVNSLRGREFVIPKKEDFEPLDMASLNENLIKHLFKYGFINENERQEMFGFFDFSLPRDVEQQEILWYQTDKEDFYLRYQQ